ncbi:RNA-dependent RNA polymerase [Vairimorpha necatrix]|uniref:RNA-dependent RNA polymerase n=1 Tax=Vairimorpha necatrix TaxID=6039 RepID=A0AAX4JCG7_9MICR
MHRQNSRFISDLTHRLSLDPSSSPLNLELLLKSLDSDVIFYLPDPFLITDFIKFYHKTLVQDYRKIDNIYIYTDEILNLDIGILCTSNMIPDNSVLIFYDLKDITLFTNNSSKFKFGFITCPLVFYEIYNSKFRDLIYAPVENQDLIFYYKKAYENSEIKKYKKLEDEIYKNEDKKEFNLELMNILKIIKIMLNSGNKEENEISKKLMFLLENGIFETEYVLNEILKDKKYRNLQGKFKEYKFVSNKLSVLLKEIRNTRYKDIEIYCKSPEILEIVHNICYNQSSINDKEYENIDHINDKTTYNIKNERKNIKFSNFENLNNNFELTICFNYKQIHSKSKKVFLIEESNFDNFLEKEKLIELEIRNKSKSPINKPKKTYSIKIHSDKITDLNLENLKISNFDKKKKLVFIESSSNFSHVGFNLNSQIDAPLEFDFLNLFTENINFSGTNLEFGTISSMKNFVNSHVLFCDTFIFLKGDFLIIYCLGERFLKIKLTSLNLEDFIFVEMTNNILNFYFCLNKKPEIYGTEDKKMNIKKFRDNEKFKFLEGLEWDRLTINEVEFIKNRNDIKISFDITTSNINTTNTNKKDSINNYLNFDKVDSNNITTTTTNITTNINSSTTTTNINTTNINSTHIYNYLNFDKVDFLIKCFARFQNVKLIFTKFRNFNKGNFLSYEEIYEYFKTKNFDDFYFLMCFLTQKSRFINYNLTKEDLEFMSKFETLNLVKYLLSLINRRFLNISKILRNYKEIIITEEMKKIRQVFITPLEIIYKIPCIFESNRVLREFDFEKFLRISLREENLKSKIKETNQQDQELIYNYYRNILNDGIFLGNKKYFFVAMTTSQMKCHNALFLTPYFSNNKLIGPDYIRNWLGDFSNIKNIGKYAMRLGQALSSTIPTVEIKDFLQIKDNLKFNYNFTDGVGIISLIFGKIIAHKLGLEEIPSAYQIRFGGYKGVIVGYPINERDLEYYKEFNIQSNLLEGVYGILKPSQLYILDNNQLRIEDINHSSDNNILIDSLRMEDNNQLRIEDINHSSDNNILIDALRMEKDVNLVLRDSMKKFHSNHRIMECISYSTTNPCHLNRQIINLLEGLGIKPEIFLEIQDNLILNLLDEISKNPINFLRKFIGLIPKNPNFKDLKIFKKLLIQISNKLIKDLYKKNKILINRGAVLMGVVDELKILKEKEVFIKVKKDLVGIYDNFIIEGEYCIILGPCLIVKNPCLHPGDIQHVRAVNKPELGFLRSVLVFNQMGLRPISNMCSGSDLDGDMYTVIWEKKLIPLNFHEPSSYEDETFLSKEIVSLKDIVNFYIKYIRNYHLGDIAYAHMVQCDLEDCKSENSKLLAELFNKSIDFPRTGFVASVPESLVPEKYPDFLQKSGNSYPSYKILGVLYRRSLSLLIEDKVKCECKECIKRFVETLPERQRLIFEGSQIKYKLLVKMDEIYLNDRSNINDRSNNNSSINRSNIFDNSNIYFFDKFKKDLKVLLKKFNVKNEEDLFVQAPTEDEGPSNDNILVETASFYRKIRQDLKDNKIDNMSLLQKSEECNENMNSLPMAFIDHKYKFEYKKVYKNKEERDNFIYNNNIKINQTKMQEDYKIIRESYRVQEDNNIIGEDSNLQENNKRNKIQDTQDKYKTQDTQDNHKIQDKYKIKDTYQSLIQGYTDVKIYKKFMENINRSLDDAFSEIFNILFLVEFFDSSFDLTCVFFLFLQSKIKSHKKLDIVHGLQKISREFYQNPTNPTLYYFIYKNIKKPKGIIYLINIKDDLEIQNQYSENTLEIKQVIDKISRTISNVAYLYIFDINLIQKYLTIKNQKYEQVHISKPEQIYKKRNIGNLIIKGMFDTSDELKLEIYKGIKNQIHRKQKVYVPKLINKGFCDIETHKINVKEFFTNSYFNFINSKIQKNQNYKVTITILPGKFYICDVPNKFINKLTTIEKLSSSLQFYRPLNNENTFKSYFFNNNELFKENRDEYMKKKNINFKTKVIFYTFSMMYKNIRYQIYYKKKNDKLKIKLITKGRSVYGKLYIINDTEEIGKDTSFELMYEEIIKKRNYENMNEEELEMFKEDVFTEKREYFKISKRLKDCHNLRIEIDTKLQTEEKDIELINREVYQNRGERNKLEKIQERLVVSSTAENEKSGVRNVSEFIKIFEKAWGIFKKYYV